MAESSDREWLAERFEEHRPHLRAVAYRMLGSVADAEDAVQSAWERASRAGADDVENLGGWLTTILARICLNMLRSRRTRREDALESLIPDPIVSPIGALGPEDEAVVADFVGLALQIVLETLSPAERLAFVLHDLFDLPFAEIGSMVGRTTEAARQLASRARRRVQGAEPAGIERDLARQQRIVDAFFAAARDGDFDALLTLLDPDVVVRVDFGPGKARSTTMRGAAAAVEQARKNANPAAVLIPALINGAAGVVVTVRERPFGLVAFTVRDGRIVEIDAIADPARVKRLAAAVLS